VKTNGKEEWLNRLAAVTIYPQKMVYIWEHLKGKHDLEYLRTYAATFH
jgi:hypothetical protein